MNKNHQIIQKIQGSTLIEVLITLVIMGVGLLGVAQMQTVSLKSNFEADQRIVAANLVSDILARLRTIPLADLTSYFGNTKKTIDISSDSQGNKQSCTSGATCTIAKKIQYDIDELTGTSDLNKASACISLSGNYVTINIAWDGIGKLKLNTKDKVSCGKSTDYNKRRTYSLGSIL